MKIVSAILAAAVVFLWLQLSELRDDVSDATALAEDLQLEVKRLKTRVEDLESR